MYYKERRDVVLRLVCLFARTPPYPPGENGEKGGGVGGVALEMLVGSWQPGSGIEKLWSLLVRRRYPLCR